MGLQVRRGGGNTLTGDERGGGVRASKALVKPKPQSAPILLGAFFKRKFEQFATFCDLSVVSSGT